MTDIIFRNVDSETMTRLIAVLGDRAEVTGSSWTQEYVSEYVASLRWNARRLVREVARAGGELDASVMRGPDGEGSLRGLTGPLRKTLNRLVAEGKLPAGLPVPVEADYDYSIASWQRTPSFKMATELVPLFSAAFRDREPVLARPGSAATDVTP